MSDAIRFVQFLHPGRERRPAETGWMIAFSRPHRRAFVSQQGSYMRKVGGRSFSAELHFWCEWECEVQLLSQFATSNIVNAPRHLFRPSIQPRKSYRGVANTDPCIFGDCFRYCVCQQPSKPSLRQLARGSIIAFGSHLSGEFVLDTLFVVARKIPYRRNEIRSLMVPETYRLASLEPLAEGCGGGEEFCLYEGATPDDSVEGMFSFFPCLPAKERQSFPRPSIRLDTRINQRHKQGIKLSAINSLVDAKDTWQSVCEQVVANQLCLGISATLPGFA